MNPVYKLKPGQEFFCYRKSGKNETTIARHRVPNHRNDEDPFYIVGCRDEGSTYSWIGWDEGYKQYNTFYCKKTFVIKCKEEESLEES